ncbi:LAME_0F06260g1_1 [Lachancea meyersii CBS 8951]|uniref:LAME_0F06260g1_1 n=1 Tax=Lachancea meyersii CBS 8951 TaxID=1266667 RepID=A0A1G4JTA8_9SACH|nr:LAME_0F06260g1_1 [Lachancea meyersii CBS 8951]
MRQDCDYTRCLDGLRELEAQLLADPFSGKSAAMISDYASLIRLLVVIVAQQHRGLRLSWRKGSALKINSEQDFSPSKNATDQIAEVVKSIDFVTELEKRFKRAQTQSQVDFRLRLKDLQIEAYEKYRQELKVHDDDKKDGDDVDGDKNVTGVATTASGEVSKNSIAQPEDKKHRLLSTNKKITSSLVRTSHMLRSSVLQSELNVSEIQEQTASLYRLNDRFDSLSGVLNTSSKVVNVIQNASGQEKRQVYSGLSFLALCISWVLWRRVFKLPVKLMLWLWFRFFRSILALLGAVPKVEVGFEPDSTAALLTATTTGTTPTVSLATVSDAVLETVKNMEDPSSSLVTMVGDVVDDAFSRLRDEL